MSKLLDIQAMLPAFWYKEDLIHPSRAFIRHISGSSSSAFETKK